MDANTAEVLVELNRVFYLRFASEFAQSRHPHQPGLKRLLSFLPKEGRVLDVGCGNGRLAHSLDREGYRVAYLGLDNSPAMLAIAQADTAALAISTDFAVVDVSHAGWTQQFRAECFDAIVALALLHHIPARSRRRDLLLELGTMLTQDGVLALSTWQFLNEPRLLRKIVPWSAAGLTADQVEPGDYLLDWQRGGIGLRYCHLIDEVELATLAAQAGLNLWAVFQDDGRTHDLNLFAILRPSR